jgi:uncharacterized repeat protein (TIGR03843 family)
VSTSPLDVLTHGDIDVEGRMPYSSNGTFLVTLTLDDSSMRAIYKPLRGERPLWDFPPGLYKREIAAHRLSAAMGFDLVPLTIEPSSRPTSASTTSRSTPTDRTCTISSVVSPPSTSLPTTPTARVATA